MTGAELRASILQAAVQGKLVLQDPNDEPASKLLERIREERRGLVKQKKAKAPRGGESVITRYPDGTVWEQRGKGAAVEITDEVPFDIPDGWEWARMASLSNTVHYGYTSPSATSGNVKLLRITDIQNGSVLWDNVPYCKNNPAQLDAYELHLKDILIARTGGTVGKSFVVQDVPETSVFASYLIRIVLTDTSLVDYISAYLGSPCYWNQLTDAVTGTGQPNVNGVSLSNLLVPIPPLVEQQRIVIKLDELVSLVERYDELDRERTELNAGIEGAMRASILQAAVQGQLTEREDGDEPAIKLLERIREERRELVKQKRAKAPRGGESVITRYPDGTVWEQRGKGAAVEITDEVPFEIPEGWEWTRLNQIGEIVGGGTPKTSESTFWASDNDPDGIPWITPADMRGMGGLMVSRGARNITKAGLEGSSAQLMPAGTVLMSSRAPIGYLGVAINPVSTNQGFKSVVCVDMDMNLWVVTAIDALMNGIKERASGTTFKEISGTEFGLTLIPIPPLAEQQRIVAKLDELLPKTEKLGKLVS